MKALNAIGRGLLATRTLRMLRICGVSLVLAAGPAMAGSAASASFTVGIRIQSRPSAVLTPEQLNARNKLLYEEQQKVASGTSRSDALDSALMPETAQTASEANRVAP